MWGSCSLRRVETFAYEVRIRMLTVCEPRRCDLRLSVSVSADTRRCPPQCHFNGVPHCGQASGIDVVKKGIRKLPTLIYRNSTGRLHVGHANRVVNRPIQMNPIKPITKNHSEYANASAIEARPRTSQIPNANVKRLSIVIGSALLYRAAWNGGPQVCR